MRNLTALVINHGLRGDQIPLEARIVTLADSLDAMTSDRPYRRALSLAEAANEITRGSGTQFDPVVVAAFHRIPLATWEEIRSGTLSAMCGSSCNNCNHVAG